MSKFVKFASIFGLVAMGAFLTALFSITTTYQDTEAVIAHRAYVALDLGVSIICLVASGVCLLVAKVKGE